MAFNRDYLQLIGPSGGKSGSLWSYRTADANTVVRASGYFAGTTTGQDASDVLGIGDLIMSATVDDVVTPTSATSVYLHIVLSNASGTVDVSDGTAITATDSD